MKTNFKAGDRVRVIVDSYAYSKYELGTVLHTNNINDYGLLPIIFDNANKNRHNLKNACNDGYGYYVEHKNLKLVKNKLDELLEPYDIVVTKGGHRYITICQDTNTKYYGFQDKVLFNMDCDGLMLLSDYDNNLNLINYVLKEHHVVDLYAIKEIYSQVHITSSSIHGIEEDDVVLKWKRENVDEKKEINNYV